MRAFPLLLLFTLLAAPAAAQGSDVPSSCKEDNSDCREDCTIEFGSSTRTYNKLGACLQKCKRKYDKCREAYLALQKRKALGIEPSPSSTTPIPPEEPGQPASTGGVASGGTGAEAKPAPTPASSSESDEPPVREGVYRASELETEPAKELEPEAPQESTAQGSTKPTPTAKSEGSKAPQPQKSEPAATETIAEPDPLADMEPAPPPPAPKRKPPPAPQRPKLPPEPKKDIADWDPNGE